MRLVRNAKETAVGPLLAAGPERSNMLLAKLADGRIRIFPPDDPEGRLRRLENEYGPVSVAYLLEDGDWREIQPSARVSRNSAIFAASLGMTTGSLPNVGSMAAPSGLSS